MHNSILPDKKILQNAEIILAKIFDEINGGNNNLNNPLLGDGLAGFAYTITYLQKNKFIDFDINSELDELDEYLFNAAKELIKKDQIDYLHGASGILHYFASRANDSIIIKQYIDVLINDLCSRAVIDKNGIWFKNNSVERLKQNNTIDISLAHGLTGILLIFIENWPYVSNKKNVEKFIQNGIHYILSAETSAINKNRGLSHFPITINSTSGSKHFINRLAWCYGDLNEVLLLYRAGKLLGNSKYTEKADIIGFQSIKRKTKEETLCSNSHFCHGTAGLAQVYKCLYAESGHFFYYDAYKYWIKQTINNIESEITQSIFADNAISILEGLAGVGMVLTEYINEGDQLNWSKVFLL